MLDDGGAPRGQVGQHAIVVHHVEEGDAPEVDAEVGADAHRPVLAPEHLRPTRQAVRSRPMGRGEARRGEKYVHGAFVCFGCLVVYTGWILTKLNGTSEGRGL